MRIVQVATGGSGGADDYILIRDEKANGTPGGSFTAGAWQTRNLNAKVSDVGGHASLASNQITLVAGTYKVEAYAPAFRVGRHKIKIRNITDGTDLVIGQSSHCQASNVVFSNAPLEGRFILAAPKIIELQHRCGLTFATQGFGVESSFGVIEVYSVIELWKE